MYTGVMYRVNSSRTQAHSKIASEATPQATIAPKTLAEANARGAPLDGGTGGLGAGGLGADGADVEDPLAPVPEEAAVDDDIMDTLEVGAGAATKRRVRKIEGTL